MASTFNQVLIGTLEKEIGTSKVLHWDVNKIGGEICWTANGKTLNTGEIQCKLCQKRLALVSQIYCPLGSSSYHRVLFICCCINPRCWNKTSSWTVVRCQKKDESQQSNVSNSKSTTWLADEDLWGNAKTISMATDLVDTVLSTAVENIVLQQGTEATSQTLINKNKEANEEDEIMAEANPNVIPESFDHPERAPDFLCDLPKEPVPLSPDESPIFKPYYIEVCEEPEGSIDEDDGHAKELLMEYERVNGNPFNKVGNSVDSKKEVESYEKDIPKHGDTSFFKFYKRISRLPSQVIRYCWNGEPLFISDATEQLGSLPNCQYCGSRKVFEVQLLPALVEGLKLNNNEGYGRAVEFGTAIVFTCERSCWDDTDNYRLESIIVQSDPDEKYFQMA